MKEKKYIGSIFDFVAEKPQAQEKLENQFKGHQKHSS